MEVFDNKLYIGFKNGDLYSFNGTSLVFIINFSNSINNLFTDNSTLYILLDNVSKIVSFNGINFFDIEVN